jgi:transcriptional regulator with XRE-family HTH domain
MADKTDFAEWLEHQLDEQEISQAELARRAGVTRAAINGILTGARGPGVDLCNGIARALKLPPEAVYRAAGIPLSDTKEDPWVKEMDHKFKLLPPDLRRVVERFVDSMLAGEESDQAKAKARKNNRPAPAKK